MPSAVHLEKAAKITAMVWITYSPMELTSGSGLTSRLMDTGYSGQNLTRGLRVVCLEAGCMSRANHDLASFGPAVN